MKHLISLFFTFVFLVVSMAFLTFAFFLIRPPSESVPEIIEEQPEEERESIFLGHPIFIGYNYYYSIDRHPDYGFDLRHNQRYLDFDHVIFPADQVTNEDIMNWAIVYLRRQGVESWGIINLDNGNQLHIWVFSSQAAVNDTFTVNYREQENDSANQWRADWWTIAHGQFSLDSEFIRWQDLEENRINSPFE